LPETWELFLKNFFESHTHALDLHEMIIFPVVVIALFIALYRKMDVRLLIGLLVANILCSLIYAFWYWEGMRLLKDNVMLFNTFNFSRFQLLRPLLWYICFALALTLLCKHLRVRTVLVTVLIVLQCALPFPLTEESKYAEIGTPTFKSFYSTDLCQEIEIYIGKDQADYRVVSI